MRAFCRITAYRGRRNVKQTVRPRLALTARGNWLTPASCTEKDAVLVQIHLYLGKDLFGELIPATVLVATRTRASQALRCRAIKDLFIQKPVSPPPPPPPFPDV